MEKSNAPSGSPKETLRAIRLLCLALITGVVIMTGIVFALVQLRGPLLDEANAQRMKWVFTTIATGLAICCFAVAIRNYNKTMTELRNSQDTLINRLNVYKGALVSYMAMTEGPGLLATILYFLCGEPFLLPVVLLMLLAMYWKWPLGSKWADEWKAGYQDLQEMEK